jgi:hypothetical protein
MAGLRSVGKIGTLSAKSPAGTVAKAPPPNKTAGRPLPNLSTPTVAPQGPAFLHLGQKRRHGTGGPGPQPPDFPGSGAEWVWFWASRKLFFNVEHIDPHQVPYDGGLTWQFADPIAQGISSRRLPAESTPDFIYESGAASSSSASKGSSSTLGPARRCRRGTSTCGPTPAAPATGWCASMTGSTCQTSPAPPPFACWPTSWPIAPASDNCKAAP